MSLEEKSQEQIDQEIREHEEQLEALRRGRHAAARGSAKPKCPRRAKAKVRKPRLGAVVIAPGIVASTVPGSLYSTILMKMALIGRFALQDRLFREFRDDPTPERARHLLDEIGVAFNLHHSKGAYIPIPVVGRQEEES